MSLDQYLKIPDKFKTEIYESLIKIRAVNGSEINNQVECDVTLRTGHKKYFSIFGLKCIDTENHSRLQL